MRRRTDQSDQLDTPSQFGPPPIVTDGRHAGDPVMPIGWPPKPSPKMAPLSTLRASSLAKSLRSRFSTLGSLCSKRFPAELGDHAAVLGAHVTASNVLSAAVMGCLPGTTGWYRLSCCGDANVPVQVAQHRRAEPPGDEGRP